MKVIYKRKPADGTIPRLIFGREYLVVGLDDENYRVVDEDSEPILYARECFDVTDASIPPDWVRDEGRAGDYYIDPPECAKRGFYEAYFDDKPEAVATFNRVLARLRAGEEEGGE